MKGTASEHLRPYRGLQPKAYTSSTNGTGVDTRGFEEALVILHAGTWTDGTHTVKVQESTDNSTFSDVSGAAFTAVSSAATDDDVWVGRLNLRNRDRYIRLVNTVASATTGAVLGAEVILCGARTVPVTQANTVAFSI